MALMASVTLAFIAATMSPNHHAHAATPADADLPAGAAPVFVGDAIDQIDFSDAGLATLQRIDGLDHPAFDHAAQYTVTGRAESTWSIQANVPNQSAVRKGDVMHLRFWARCLESMTGEGFAAVKFELGREPYHQALSQQISYAGQWRQFDFPFVADRDYAPNTARISLQLGFDQQVAEFAGMSLRNYGQGFDLDRLPRTRFSYPGREADAAWRAEAEERIDRIRKADLALTVLDAQGRPVPDARVHVEMRRHAFRFGSAVVAQEFYNPASESPYLHWVETLFNEVVFENDLKWVNHGTGHPDHIEAALQWLEARDITVRGHVMVWPGWNWLPPELQELADDPVALRAAVHERVTTVGSRYAGRIHDWDVINEPFNNYDLMNILGDEIMDESFHLAKQSTPDAVRYINDWGILTNGGVDTRHQDHYFDTIQGLIDRGAPIQGIGFQGHFGSTLTPPTRMLEIMDRYAATGLRLKITELDIVMLDEELRADYLRDVVTTAFSHPAMDGVVLWGFWANRHWKPSAALFTSDWQVKPHGQAWIDLTTKTWWTDEDLATDARGQARTRGFLGEYQVTVEHDGRTLTQDAELTRGGLNLHVHLP